MSANSLIILPSQTHTISNSTPMSVTSSQFEGDGYYSKTDGYHTTQYNLVDFTGSIVIQATLSTNPTDVDWFDVAETLYTSTSPSTGSFLYNFVGNYVYVRAYVSNWITGTITSISYNH